MPTLGGEVLCGIVAEWTAQHENVAIERGVQNIGLSESVKARRCARRSNYLYSSRPLGGFSFVPTFERCHFRTRLQMGMFVAKSVQGVLC